MRANPKSVGESWACPAVCSAAFREQVFGAFDRDSRPNVASYALHEGFGLKRFLDILIVLATLPLVAPLIALGALCIWAQDRGPVLFVQDRIGRFGRVFRMYKLRTMRFGVRGAGFTATSDSRVTPIGFWLRRYRVDELPQIINVLRGEMSLCGPRPESAELVRSYEKEIPRYHFRHLIAPGMTGLAQVSQGYAAGAEDCSEKLRIDMIYARAAGPLYDLQLLFKTVGVLVFGFGAR